MKDIKDFINESNINEAKNSLGFDKNYQIPVTWRLVQWTDGYGVNFDDMDLGDDTPDEARELFGEVFAQCIEDSMRVDLGNWNPDFDSDDWDYFWEETGLDEGKDHGLVLHQDGDDGDFTVLVFTKRIPTKYRKYMDDFKAMFSDNTVAEF